MLQQSGRHTFHGFCWAFAQHPSRKFAPAASSWPSHLKASTFAFNFSCWSSSKSHDANFIFVQRGCTWAALLTPILWPIQGGGWNFEGVRVRDREPQGDSFCGLTQSQSIFRIDHSFPTSPRPSSSAAFRISTSGLHSGGASVEAGNLQVKIWRNPPNV